MKQESKIREFLNLFSYADDDAKKKESINYIIEVLSKAEAEKKTLTFDKMGETGYMPNPLVSNTGRLMLNTGTFMTFFNDWVDKTQYVKTEVANVLLESLKVYNDMIGDPITKDTPSEPIG